MTVMNVLTADDLSYVKVEIKNVSVKYYTFDTDIIHMLYSRFKYDQPTKITFGSENTYTREFKKKLYDDGYELDEDGKVLKMEKKEICYNTLEHIIEDELSLFTIDLHNEYDQQQMIEILIRNGYIISGNQDTFNISIHGKK